MTRAKAETAEVITKAAIDLEEDMSMPAVANKKAKNKIATAVAAKRVPIKKDREKAI